MIAGIFIGLAIAAVIVIAAYVWIVLHWGGIQ